MTARTSRKPRPAKRTAAEAQALATLQAALDEHEVASRQTVSWLVRGKDLADRWKWLGLMPEDFHHNVQDIARAVASAPTGRPVLEALAEVAGADLALRAGEIAAREPNIPAPAGLHAYGLRRARLRVDLARASADGDAIKAGDVTKELSDLEARGKLPGGCGTARSPFDVKAPETLKAGDRLDTAPPKPDWLLTGLLKRGGLALVCGPGGVGKSTLLLDLAASIAAQKKTALAWEAAGGRVLFCTFEDDPDEVHRRLFYTARGLDLGHYERERIRDRLYLLAVAGDVRLVTESPNGPSLTSTWGDLCGLVRQLAPALVILDPLSRINGADENDPATAQLLTASLEALARETGTAFILSHHSNKAGSGADTLADRLKVESIRGSSAFPNAVRTALTCAPLFGKEARSIIGDQDAKDGQYLALKVAKCNHGPNGAEFYFKRGEGGALEQVAPSVRLDELQRMDALKIRVAALLGELAEKGQPVTRKSFVDGYTPALKEEEGLGRWVSKSKVEVAIAGLLLAGSIQLEARLNKSNRMTEYLVPVTRLEPAVTREPANRQEPAAESLPLLKE